MTDHPSALVSVPDAMTVCVAIAPYLGATDANDWTGLEDDDAISMAVKMRVGDLRALKAVISAPAAPQAAGVRAVDEVARWHEDRAAFLTSKAADDDWAETEAQLHRDMAASLRAPSREPEGGAVDYEAVRIATDLHTAFEKLIYGLPKYLDAENLTDEENMIREAWITLDVTAHRLAALATREEAPAEAGEVEDPELPDTPEARTIFKHFCDVHGLRPDEAAEAAGHLIADLSALRAQPQAREDAQPVAWTGSGSLARIKGRAGNFQGYIYGTPDAAHPIALYTQPATDALLVREALSALVIADDHRPSGMGNTADWMRNSYGPAIALARQALAALQAEQGAK